MGLLLATCDIVQVFVVIRFLRNLLTEITVKTWVNGAVRVSAHADILFFLLNFQTLQFSSVQPVSPVQIPCRAYFCGSEPQTECKMVWCVFINVLFFFFCSVHLYYLFPSLEEGGLATYRTAIVQNQHLAMLAKVCQNSAPGVLLSPCIVLDLNHSLACVRA